LKTWQLITQNTELLYHSEQTTHGLNKFRRRFQGHLLEIQVWTKCKWNIQSDHSNRQGR